MSAQTVQVNLAEYDKTLLKVIDTPGIELGSESTGGPDLRAKERERAIKGLMTMLEERFEGVLREESRIVRAQKKGEDDLIHLGEFSRRHSMLRHR